MLGDPGRDRWEAELVELVGLVLEDGHHGDMVRETPSRAEAVAHRVHQQRLVREDVLVHVGVDPI